MGKDMSLPSEDLGVLFQLERDPVLGISQEGTVVFSNPAALNLFGLRPGDSARDVVPAEVLYDPACRFVAAFQAGGQSFTMYAARLEALTVCSFRPLHVKPPAPAQANAVHVLSSSMMNMRMALDALVSGTGADGDPAFKETAETLYREYHRMRRACDHMAKADGILNGGLPYDPQVVDLGTLCRELCDTVGLLAEGMGLTVCFKVDDGLHLTMADAGLIESMLSNLLTNSIAHCRPGDRIKVELTRQGNRFILAVEDPGSGIAPEKLADIFSPDAAQGDGPAGLGLLIARGAAERHGGALILESRPGHGVAVRVSIPYRRTDDMHLGSPRPRYRASGMSTVLTELSVVLDKKYYNRRYFD